MRFTPFSFLGSSGVLVDYLIVAGGGSGGNAADSGAGGGGAGGLLSGSKLLDEPSTYSVTVGEGGVYVIGNASGSNGEDSSLFGFTAIGGGGGGGYKPIGSPAVNTPFGPGIGGSGGGGANNTQNASPEWTAGAEGTSGQGFAGGDGSSWLSGYGGGGGGGSSQAGIEPVVNGGGTTTLGGDGGSGSVWLDGNFYAGGGGGSGGDQVGSSLAGVGGIGGGGNGAVGSTTSTPVAGGNATPNTGGGGGGGFFQVGGSGGSGVVIIRYPGSVPLATGGVITSGSGHVYHTFLSSSDFVYTN